MSNGTPSLPGLITQVPIKEQSQDCRGPDFLIVVRAIFSCEAVLDLAPIPTPGHTPRFKSRLKLASELLAFHQSGCFRQSPLAKWHYRQVQTIESRHYPKALPWLALAAWSGRERPVHPDTKSKCVLGQRREKNRVPKPVKPPNPV